MTGTQRRHEQFPESADLAHWHPAAVPAVEVADDADPTSVRCPDRECYAFDAFMETRVSPQLAIAGEVIALPQKVDVKLTENRREAIDVMKFLPNTAAQNLQLITEWLFARGNLRDKQSLRMHLLALDDDFAGGRVENRHFLRSWEHRADATSSASPVLATMPRTPFSVMSTQLGRFASSYETS